jgi:hypothetical protein
MRKRTFYFLAAIAFFISSPGWIQKSWSQNSQPPKPPANGGDFSNVLNPVSRVPEGVILVKGAWSSASDSATPDPEASSFDSRVFRDPYFAISYALAAGWEKGYDGPPPSDSGRYVVAQFRFIDTNKSDPNKSDPGASLQKTAASQTAPSKTPTRASILITAQDMFFTRVPATNALQLANYTKDNLQADYKIEEPPTPTEIAGRPFTFYAYWSPAAELHWYVLSTEIRCHTLEIVLTSRDTKLLANLLLDLNKMTLPAEANPTAGNGGGEFPVCLKDYASDENMTARADPIFTEHRVNPVPVRIIIDKNGKVKHIHFLSAFPDQAKAITDALAQWKFKPHVQDGHAVEVETGIMFGRAPAAPGTQRSTVE